MLSPDPRTSPMGFVHEVSSQPPRAYLADFDIDGATLKIAHLAWLSAKVIQPVKKGGRASWKVYLEGMTSRPASEVHNLWLSQRRAQAVVAYLTANLIGFKVDFDPHWSGELRAKEARHPEQKENASDRAVLVCLQLLELPPPEQLVRQERVHIHRSNWPKEFRIRLVGAYSAGHGLSKKPGLSVQVENVYFLIHDKDAKTQAFYVYSGFGLSGGLPIKLLPKKSAGVTYRGDWNEFSAPIHSVEHFGGASRFFQGALNLGTSLSYNTFCFGGFRSWFHYLVEIKGFKTGKGVGLPSGSETIGTLQLKTRAMPFTETVELPAPGPAYGSDR
jgi:hypothetical protein